ncbi:MAG: hypothetical protein WBC83_03270 [Minisyncoccia bacterium]
MDKIYNIKYVDAWSSYDADLYADKYYTDKKDLKAKSTSVYFFSAYGFVERHGSDIVVAFIKKRGVPLNETIKKKEKIIDGLVIPDVAMLSKVSLFSHSVLKGLKMDSRVAVTWRDPTYIKRLPEYDCSVLYTEGTLHKIEKDHIVLRDTETIRVHPMPIKNHPAGRPLWYVIPISFIKDVENIS